MKPVSRLISSVVAIVCIVMTTAVSAFPGGFFDYDGKPYHYLTDYQGNNIGLLDKDGKSVQGVTYYPSGEPWLEPNYGSGAAGNRFLFGGKERETAGAANLYDFSARYYSAAFPRFLSIDPKCEKFAHLNPYSYCAGNPVNLVDPDGEDIVVLNYTEGEHIAMLIQNDEGKWQYYSVNGNNMYILCFHIGGREFNDVAKGSWDSPQEFLNSSYNVRNGKSKDDKEMNHFCFSEGYQIYSTPDQDKTMRNSFIKTAKTKYNLFNNNCATAVQKALIEAGIPVSEPTMVPSRIPMHTPFGIIDVYNGYKMKCDIQMMPSSTFESIIKFNPSGHLLHKK